MHNITSDQEKFLKTDTTKLAEQQELSYTAGNEKWCNNFGKHFRSFL